MAGSEEMVPFSFFVPKNLNSNKRKLVASYKETSIEINWNDSDEGQLDFQSVLNTLPTMVEHIRREIDIRREVDQIDKDLEALNDD